jgi:hypothetical protein
MANPRSMNGKVWLKWLFLGPLFSMPSTIELSRIASLESVVLDPNRPTGHSKILYAVSSRR